MLTDLQIDGSAGKVDIRGFLRLIVGLSDRVSTTAKRKRRGVSFLTPRSSLLFFLFSRFLFSSLLFGSLFL